MIKIYELVCLTIMDQMPAIGLQRTIRNAGAQCSRKVIMKQVQRNARSIVTEQLRRRKEAVSLIGRRRLGVIREGFMEEVTSELNF